MKREKKRGKKVIWWAAAAAALIIIAVVIQMNRGGGEAKSGLRVEVARENVIEKALAVGSIEPEQEISVKSKVSGVVHKVFKNPGESVKRGEPLLEIAPDPTPLEIAGAERKIEMDQIALQAAERKINRSEKLLEQGLISRREYEDTEKEYRQAKLQLKISREQLALLEKGRVNIAGKKIESIIKAPISGKILEKKVNIGDPVVPLTSYQAGTVLMTMADMDSIIFKGTVDEIDVGKLDIGMPVNIKVGALPDIEIPGTLERISLKAREENNSRMFPVEIRIEDTGVALLRAGYSANADIIINRRDSVLTIPERVVYYRGDSVYVEVAAEGGGRDTVMIETGLSDAIRVEVTAGLKKGWEVLEKPRREL